MISSKRNSFCNNVTFGIISEGWLKLSVIHLQDTIKTNVNYTRNVNFSQLFRFHKNPHWYVILKKKTYCYAVLKKLDLNYQQNIILFHFLCSKKEVLAKIYQTEV